MAFSGMTPDQIDAAASQLRAQAQELQSVSSKVTSLVDEAARCWQGNDVASFRSAWYGSYRSRLSTAKSHLESMASELNRQATQQRDTSSASTVNKVGSITIPAGGSAGGPAMFALGGSAAAGADSISVASNVAASVWDSATILYNFADGVFADGWHLSPFSLDIVGGTFLYPHMAASDWMEANGLPKDYESAASGMGFAKFGTVVSGISLVSDVMTLATGWQDMHSPYEKVSAVANTVSDATATVAGVGTLLLGAGKIALDSPLAKVVPGLNIASNIASAVSDGAQAINDFQNGNWGHGILNGVEALASVASCIPGPIGVVGTVASLGLHAVEGVLNVFKK